MKRSLAAGAVASALFAASASAFDQNHLTKLMQTNECAGCNLTGANLSNGNFSDADLFKANLNEAIFDNTILAHTNLSEANLSKANLSTLLLYRFESH